MEIKGIKLKKFHEFKCGHGDSMTLDSDIWMDGHKIGHVSNDGWGGDNLYEFIVTDNNGKDYRDDDSENEFYKRCKDWGKENNDYLSPDDSLINELILYLSLEKDKKSHMKKGLPMTLLCRKNKRVYKLPAKDGKPESVITMWNKMWTVGIKNEQNMKYYLEKEKVESYEEIKL